LSIKKNISVTLLSQILNTVVGFVASIYVTRLLGVEAKGEYSLFSNSLTLAGIWLGFSLPSGIIYYVSSKKIDGNKMFATGITIAFLTSIMVFLCLKILFSINAQWIVFPSAYQSFLWQILFVLMFFLAQVNSIATALLSANKIFVPQAVFNTVLFIISTTMWILIYYNVIQLKLKGFPLVCIVSFLIGLPNVFFIIYLLYAKTDIKLSNKLLNLTELKSIVRFSFIVYITNAIQFFTYRMDLWFVDYYHGKAETGVYSLAVGLSQLLWIFPAAISSVLFSYAASDDKRDITYVVTQSCRFTFFISLVLGIFGSILSYFFVPLFFGKGFSDASFLITLLVVGIIPFAIVTVLGSYIAGINKPKINLYSVLIGFFICLVLDIILIKYWGAKGASVATSVSYISIAVYVIFVFKKLNELKLVDLFLINKNDIVGIKNMLKKIRRS
jgi:O-antigen/teichoic acid export membrane protein